MKLYKQLVPSTALFFLCFGINCFGDTPGPNPPNAATILAKTVSALFGDGAASTQSITLYGEGMAFGFPAGINLSANAAGMVALDTETVHYSLLRTTGRGLGWEKQSWQNLGDESGFDIRELDPRADSRSRPFFIFSLLNFSLNPDACSLPEQQTSQQTGVYVLECKTEKGIEIYQIRALDFLPLSRSFEGRYAEGSKSIKEVYDDYRSVGKLTLPYSISLPDPDLPGPTIDFYVSDYEASPELQEERFTGPASLEATNDYEVTLQTVPFNVYKEADWIQGIDEWDQNPRWATTIAPTETWTFDLLVDEREGRWLEPISASVSFLSGNDTIKTVEFSGNALDITRRRNVSRYAGFAGIMVFRHHFTEPADLEVDAMVYRLNLVAPDGSTVSTERQIPVSRYQQKTKLIFPIKGDFIITSGHDWDDINHKDEWQQWGAYDIAPLGEGYSYRTSKAELGTAEFNESFWGYGRDVLAPAAGEVIYAREGVPDQKTDDFWEKTKLPRDLWEMPGNLIIIDHGNNEYSFFAHLKNGSLKVKAGDSVEQGQVIASLGNSNGGIPHLHYHLMSGPVLLRSDGLPSEFENLREIPPMGKKIRAPKRGHYLTAE